MAMRVFKCPFCGYRFRADPEERYRRGRGAIVRGKPEPSRTQTRYTVDLTCPNCQQDFEVEVEV